MSNRSLVLSIAGLITMLVLVCGLSAISTRTLRDLELAVHTLRGDRLDAAVQLSEAQRGIYLLHDNLLARATASPERRVVLERSDEQLIELIDQQIAAYADTYLLTAEVQGLADFRRTYSALLRARGEALAAIEAGDSEPGPQMAETLEPLFVQSTAQLEELISIQQRVATEIDAAADSNVRLAVIILVADALGVLVVAAGLAVSGLRLVSSSRSIAHSALEHLVHAEERERRRLAYEIHDTAAQTAAGVGLRLRAFAETYAAELDSGARIELDGIVDQTDVLALQTRSLIGGLRPLVLERTGLVEALRQELSVLRHNGLEVEFDENIGGLRLPPSVALVLFRVAQEALANVRKHALTNSARISLRHTRNRIRLEIQDAGCGLQSRPSPLRPSGSHFGLVAMRERIGSVGGRLTIASRPGLGTRVVAEVEIGSAVEVEVAGAA
jgi:signal transduction histidine kinase